ncbi:hypothetical protein CAL7716_080870 [Calothrix sp. PCC 7716]|nr:hypothetical protein CAL7716_080870 [Calothrix sp. PCC 7716]
MTEFMQASIDSENNICPVNSYNEWDPLEEVIVGRLDGANIPPYHVVVTHNLPRSTARLYRPFAGQRYPRFLVKRAQKALDEFIHILKSEGVVVRQPDLMNFSVQYKTPY